MKEIAVVCTALVFASCATPWKNAVPNAVAVGGSSVDWNPVPGGHCESSALVNALRYSGWDVAEHQVIGGGGALSFVFVEGDFPFIGARNNDMREQFSRASGIGIHAVVPESDGADWDRIAGLLASGSPVCLRVDMRFLPYRYGGKYGPSWMSFGAHWIALYALDPVGGTALVSDTEYQGLKTVSIKDLHRARTSSTKNFPPKAEYCWVDRPPAASNPDAQESSGSAPASSGRALSPMPAPADSFVEASLRTVYENYRGGALDGLERFGDSLAAMNAWEKKRYLLQPVLEYLAGNIEDYGTGGASFRMPYRDFLAWAAGGGTATLPKGRSEELLGAIDASVARWHDLSAALRAEAAGAKQMNSSARGESRKRLNTAADRLYEAELVFYEVLASAQKSE